MDDGPDCGRQFRRFQLDREDRQAEAVQAGRPAPPEGSTIQVVIAAISPSRYNELSADMVALRLVGLAGEVDVHPCIVKGHNAGEINLIAVHAPGDRAVQHTTVGTGIGVDVHIPVELPVGVDVHRNIEAAIAPIPAIQVALKNHMAGTLGRSRAFAGTTVETVQAGLNHSGLTHALPGSIVRRGTDRTTPDTTTIRCLYMVGAKTNGVCGSSSEKGSDGK